MPAATAIYTSPAVDLQNTDPASRNDAANWAAAALTSTSQGSKLKSPEVQSTIGTVWYTKPPTSEEGLHIYIYKPQTGVDDKSSVSAPEPHDVTVTDLRSVPKTFTLQRNGFQLEKLDVPKDIDWSNNEEVQEKYYPAIEKLLKKVTGASRTFIFDHTLRKGPLNHEKEEKDRRKPVPRVHVDYTTESGYKRLDELMPKEEADRLRKTPFAVIQVWRPLKGPVDDAPLGMIDAETVSKDDLMPLSLHFPERVGQTYALKHNPNHRFYYAKGIAVDEAYVFVCYDSRADRARFTPHTGFLDHGTSAGAPLRESVELRSYCFWEDEEPQEAVREL
jgi:hypothetical protein